MENYEDTLSRMQRKFTELTGFDADEASDIGIRLKVLAGEIFSLNTNIEWLKNQMFVKTASGKYLDYHAEQRGIARKLAVSSSGTLTFSVETALDYDVDIPLGTVCSLSSSDGTRYVTIEEATLKAGDLSVVVNAKSELGGKNTNTAQNTVKVMITPPVGIDSVTNATAFTGGYDAESDEELRLRLIESYKNIPNGTNIAFYKNEVLKYEGVYSASVIPLARGNGTVDIYVSGKGAKLDSNLIAAVQSDISKLREINVDVKVKSPDLVKVDVLLGLTVKAGYVFSEVKEECTEAINKFFSELHIGEQVIFAAIGQKIFEVDGVKNYSFKSNLDFDKVVDNDELAIPGTISITEG